MESTIWQQKWVVGNWKMNGQLHDNNALVHKLRSLPAAERVCIGISPPTVYLLQAHNAVQIVLDNKIHVCAQDVSRFADKGAYTGEVSAEMLKDVGVDIVLIGHSERSLYFNEKNDVQRQKIENVLRVGLIPLLCVGESLKEREDGREKEAVAYQLSVFKGLKTQNFAVAYEPVWAIGTGKVANELLVSLVREFFDLRPYGLIKMLDLIQPIYRQTAAYGHFGREQFPWEKIDRAADLRAAAGLK